MFSVANCLGKPCQIGERSVVQEAFPHLNGICCGAIAKLLYGDRIAVREEVVIDGNK